MVTLKNLINGQWVESRGDTEQVYNPANGETLADISISTSEDVDDAVQSAQEAFESWSKTPVPKRARIMYAFHHLLVEHHEELAEILTKENGKTYKDAYGEVLRGIENVEFASGAPDLMKGEILNGIANGIDSGMYRYPVGVVGGITPFNFPMMVPCWMFPLAIALGNTFVLKPSESTPLLAQRLAELLQEAGLPDGVFNIVHGSKDVVNGLLEHENVDAISFVGSEPVAKHVYETASKFGKRVQALGGAKNHSIILNDANLDKTAEGVISGAFGSAGQRCMATSVCVVQEDIADEFLDKLIKKSDQLKIGDGLDESVDLGPVISDKHLEKVKNYIETGIQENATLLRDGRKDVSDFESGYYLGATIFDDVNTDMTIWKEEIFAPFLCIIRVKDLEEAIAVTNESEFGNGSVIYTESGAAVQKYRDNVEVGMLGVNVNVPAPMGFFPFSGWKNSFYGDLHTNGKDGVEFYTQRKMLTSRWFN